MDECDVKAISGYKFGKQLLITAASIIIRSLTILPTSTAWDGDVRGPVSCDAADGGGQTHDLALHGTGAVGQAMP
jgi:hypothetical protein